MILRRCLFGADPPRRLYLTAIPAERKSRPGCVLVSDPENISRFGQLAEVHVAKRDSGNELKSEWDIRCTELPRFLDVFRFEVCQELPHIELWLAIIGAVVDANTGIVAVSNRLTEPQQLAALGLIGPHCIS